MEPDVGHAGVEGAPRAARVGALDEIAAIDDTATAASVESRWSEGVDGQGRGRVSRDDGTAPTGAAIDALVDAVARPVRVVNSPGVEGARRPGVYGQDADDLGVGSESARRRHSQASAGWSPGAAPVHALEHAAAARVEGGR